MTSPPQPGVARSGRPRWAARLAALAAFGLLLAAPWGLPAYDLLLLDQVLVLAIAGFGLNLLLGMGGLLPLGHALYFGLGAYAGAFLYRFGPLESLAPYLAAGVIASGAAAGAIGFLCARTGKIYFAILSLAVAEIGHSLVVNGAVFEPFGGLGRAIYYIGEGSLYLPRLKVLGTEIGAKEFPGFFHLVAAAAFGLTVLGLRRLDRSPFALALRAIRDNPTRAEALGISVPRYRWAAFAISGAVAGLAGALYGQLHRQITPDQLEWLFSAKLVAMIVIGGSREFLGPALGAFLLVALEEVAGRWPFGQNAILGALLILAGLAFPAGIAGGIRALFARLRRSRDGPGG
ncbi:MAG: branched-chain amino acid ABC transporter permease [Rhodospirillales bacterium]|nr:branched-chain amino acid ABC transporter permease [Rhodospirillales bacterium]